MATKSADRGATKIEKIVDRRVINGITEYCVKLKGHDKTTWEAKEKLDCPQLIAAFEEKENTENRSRRVIRKEGFNRGLSPEKILGATMSPNDEVSFLIKWKFCDELDLVLSKDANVKCPQLVIKFYEERLKFSAAVSD